jgi:hypothetical protein
MRRTHEPISLVEIERLCALSLARSRARRQPSPPLRVRAAQRQYDAQRWLELHRDGLAVLVALLVVAVVIGAMLYVSA